VTVGGGAEAAGAGGAATGGDDGGAAEPAGADADGVAPGAGAVNLVPHLLQRMILPARLDGTRSDRAPQPLQVTLRNCWGTGLP
jgi:hypothetical protein